MCNSVKNAPAGGREVSKSDKKRPNDQKVAPLRKITTFVTFVDSGHFQWRRAGVWARLLPAGREESWLFHSCGGARSRRKDGFLAVCRRSLRKVVKVGKGGHSWVFFARA